jgi:hypothetical protein
MLNRTFEFKTSGHLEPALRDPSTKALNADKLTGRWLNTNPETDGITEIVIERDGNEFWISASGAGEADPIAWPRTNARAIANLEEEGGQRAVAFTATFEFGFMQAETYLRVNKGVLVIVVFHTFQDGSERSNYLNREFFYRPN